MKLTAMNEFVFYYAIASNQKYMKSLLETILNKKIYELIPLNTKLMKDNLNSKSKYLDYAVKTNEGIINRNLTYLCQIVANSSRQGKCYMNIPKQYK